MKDWEIERQSLKERAIDLTHRANTANAEKEAAIEEAKKLKEALESQKAFNKQLTINNNELRTELAKYTRNHKKPLKEKIDIYDDNIYPKVLKELPKIIKSLIENQEEY